MKLISVHIKNYRIHKDIKIDFNSSLTLIGGPNEIGKSTIAEAIHRCLFLKATGNTEEHRQMKSTVHGGNPEVELIFEVNSIKYTLKKIFGNGASATTILSSPTQTPLKDDEADQMLGNLLSTTVGLTQKSYKTKWEHLWVWQGTGLKDSSDYANLLRNDLIDGLKTKGAAIVLQSKDDYNVIKSIELLRNLFLTDTGKIKANSELDTSQKNLKKRESELTEAKCIFDEVIDAATKLGTIEKELKDLEIKLINERENLKSLRSQKDMLQNLRSKEDKQKSLVDTHQKSLEKLLNEDDEINDARVKIDSLMKALEPTRFQIEQLNSQKKENDNQLDDNQKKYNKCVQVLIKNNNLKSFFRALREKIDIDELIYDVNEIQSKIVAKENTLKELNQKLVSIVDIDESKLEELKIQNNKIAEIKEVIKSIATEIKLVSSSVTVKVNDVVFLPNEQSVIVDNSNVQIGDLAYLEIIPGGGQTLKEKKDELRNLERKFSAMLMNYGVSNIKEATEFKAQRDVLINNKTIIERELGQLDPEGIKNKINFNKQKRTRINAELRQKMKDADIAEDKLEEMSANINSHLSSVDDEIIKCNDLERELSSENSRLQNVKKDIAGKIIDLENKSSENEEQLQSTKITLGLWINERGDDQQRAEALEKHRQVFRLVNESLEKIQIEISEMNEDNLERDIKRSERTEQNIFDRKIALYDSRARNQQILETHSVTDPNEAYDKSKNALIQAKHQFEILEKKSNAIQLLHQLFLKEQQNISLAFTAPLSQSISSYLKCVYNTDIQVNITDMQGEFQGISLSREGILSNQAFSFDDLSGGTKEQFSAAVRLAMAEVLSANYNDCLPIIFDDAFVNTDPERITNIQQMLDYAANQQGLQIILFTCNPIDYLRLGAKEIILN
jgi:DNA repair exonuclease SbcCD ATPase subunit